MAFFDFLTGADEGAKAIKKATQQAIQFQREGQDKAVGALTDRLAPGANYGPIQSKLYDLSGVNGAQAQQDAFGRYVESPEVAFMRQQGEQAIQRSAAARGGLTSGRTLTDLAKFGQDLAQQGYSDYFGRLRDLYGSALNTAGALGSGVSSIYSNGGNNLANIAMSGGQQKAQYDSAAGGVLGDLLSQGLALAGYAGGQYLGRPGSTGSSYGGSSRNAYMPAAYGPNFP